MTKSEQMKKDEKMNEKLKSSKLECYRSGYKVGVSYGVLRTLVTTLWAMSMMIIAFVVLHIPETGPPNRDAILMFGIMISSALFLVSIDRRLHKVFYKISVNSEEQRLLKKREETSK